MTFNGLNTFLKAVYISSRAFNLQTHFGCIYLHWVRDAGGKINNFQNRSERNKQTAEQEAHKQKNSIRPFFHRKETQKPPLFIYTNRQLIIQ